MNSVTLTTSYKLTIPSPLVQINTLNSRLSTQSQDQEGKLQEYAQLLDIKSARIKKLESQLKDIAYGTRQYKVDTSKFEVSH